MELTTEQIDAEAFARWGDMKGAPLAMCRGFARAIEAEVRKQDDALILQLVEALETCNEGDGYNGPYQYHNEIAVESAITAGRARLEGKP